MEEKKKRLIIIDSNSVIHRAFHALPPLTNKKGEVVGAVYGFLLVFFKAIKDFQPDYIAACFDFHAPTFRHKKFKEYKANRPHAPEELYSQIPKVKEVLKSFGVPIFEKEGFEADDIIGTIASLSPVETIILSGDADNLQLVDAKTQVYLLRKGVKDIVLYNRKAVEEKYGGLTPEQLVDFKGLRGDSSDNIPGVAGIGEKTATSLILEFGGLDLIYNNLALITSKVEEKLTKNKEQAYLSRELATIEKKVPLDFNLEKCRFNNYNHDAVREVLKELGFHSLISRL